MPRRTDGLPRFLKNLPAKVDELLATFPERHRLYVTKVRFSGPSLYFHQKALKMRTDDWSAFADASYAMLVAWGMHRMGTGGAKMQGFEAYCSSLQAQWRSIQALQKVSRAQMCDEHWHQLETVFSSIHAMDGKTILVANSKVLAHALPELVAPIDRQYTLRYLMGTKSVPISSDRQVQIRLFIALHRQFFHPLAAKREFLTQANGWINSRACPWDTSVLKVLDNCLISGRPDSEAAA